MAPPKRLGRGLDSIIAGVSAASPMMPPTPAGTKTIGIVPSADEIIKSQTPPPSTSQKQEAVPNEGFFEIETDLIDVSPFKPRKDFDEDNLNELADSIRSEGLLQPITVRKTDKRFELIAGERRLRACRKLGLKRIWAHIVDASDSSSAIMSLIENLQRTDLNPVEEALGYASLMDDFDLNQEAVAERVGKRRSSIANLLRILQLNKECQGFLRKGLITFGHARALLALESQEEQTLLARRVIESGLSVRDTEQDAARMKQGRAWGKKTTKRISQAELAVIKDLEKRISKSLHTRVKLKHNPKRGTIIIEYFGNDDLQRILEKLGLET